MNFFKPQKTERSLLRETALLLLVVCGLLVAVDQLSVRCGLEGWQRIADDLLGGLIAAAIFYFYERRILRRFHEHIRLIDLMNHHIRNALQPLMFVRYEPDTAAQMQLIEDCVNYIDWTLREILPGKSQKQFVALGPDLADPRPRTNFWPLPQPDSTNSRLEPRNWNPQAFFAQWLDTWKNRNQAPRGELFHSGFSARTHSIPWKKNRSTFPEHKQRGSHE